MKPRLHPPALDLFEQLSAGRLDAAEWLRRWHGEPRTLSYGASRAAADDLAVVLEVMVRRGAAFESASRLYRALARRAIAVPRTTVETPWKLPRMMETPAALEVWLEGRFGSLKDLDDARRRLVRAALEMLESVGLVSSAAAIHAELLKCSLEVSRPRSRTPGWPPKPTPAPVMV
jgi:hypothetical protein